MCWLLYSLENLRSIAGTIPFISCEGKAVKELRTCVYWYLFDTFISFLFQLWAHFSQHNLPTVFISTWWLWLTNLSASGCWTILNVSINSVNHNLFPSYYSHTKFAFWIFSFLIQVVTLALVTHFTLWGNQVTCSILSQPSSHITSILF